MVGAGCRRYTRRIRAAACTRRMQGSGRTRMSRSIAVGNERRLCDRVSMARARSGKTYRRSEPTNTWVCMARWRRAAAYLHTGSRMDEVAIDWQAIPVCQSYATGQCASEQVRASARARMPDRN